MAKPANHGNAYSGQDLSASQLLHAARKKMREIMLSERCVSSPLICGMKSFKSGLRRTTIPLSEDELNANRKTEFRLHDG